MELPWLNEVAQVKRPQRLPVVLTPTEVRGLLLHVDGTPGLVAQLLYGTGMRLVGNLCTNRRVACICGLGQSSALPILAIATAITAACALQPSRSAAPTFRLIRAELPWRRSACGSRTWNSPGAR